MKHSTFFLRLGLAFFVFCYPFLSFSQNNFWEQANGPSTNSSGGSVNAIVLTDSSYFFMGLSGGGIYRSTDRGISWVESGLAGGIVQSITLDSLHNVWVTLWLNGVYWSNDHGVTWLHRGLSKKRVRALKITASGDIWVASENDGVYRSTDNGKTWLLIGFLGVTVKTLDISPKGDIFLGTYGGIYRSEDNGTTWFLVERTLYIDSFVINSNGYLFAGTAKGVFGSGDNGYTWTRAGLDFNFPWCLSTEKDSLLFAGTDRGLYYTYNGGATWLEAGLSNKRVLSIGFYKNKFFAGTDGSGMFYSTDNGKTWSRNAEGIVNGQIISLAIDVNNNIFAGTWYEGVWRSTNNANTWSFSGLKDNAVNCFLTTSKSQILAGSNVGLFRSSDQGLTWKQISTIKNVTSLAIDSTGRIFTGTIFDTLFYSTDNGDSWVHCNNGLTSPWISSVVINSKGHIFASSPYRGIFRSTDNGNHWAQVNNGLTNNVVNCLLVNTKDYVFAGTSWGGIFRSTDNGESWVQVNNGLEFFDLDITSFTINSKGNLFAGSRGETVPPPIGVLRSTNDGASWERLFSGLRHRSVRSLTVNTNDFIFAGTWGGGVYRSTQPTTEVEKITSTVPEVFSLKQNYPNPFNPTTTIEFSLSHHQHVTLKIYNTLGKEIETLVAQDLGPGKFHVNWNAHEQTSGVYLYRLQAGKFVDTKKLLFIK